MINSPAQASIFRQAIFDLMNQSNDISDDEHEFCLAMIEFLDTVINFQEDDIESQSRCDSTFLKVEICEIRNIEFSQKIANVMLNSMNNN